MKNMAAASWSRDREKKMVQRKKSKIHKVMHFQTSQQDVPTSFHHNDGTETSMLRETFLCY
jgi:hypothetical protein